MKRFFTARPHIVPCLVAIILLITAVTDRHKYGFYQILRWVVCGSAGFIAFLGFAKENPWIFWPYLASAILFNPLVPFHFKRDTWQAIDWAMIPVFLLAILLIRPTPEDYPVDETKPPNPTSDFSAKEYLEIQAKKAEKRYWARNNN